MATLEITTNVGCVLACKFCPQDKISKLYKRGDDRLMSLDNFLKIISKLPRNVRIDFSGYSEPFLNPSAIDMVDAAVARGFEVTIYSTLMGINWEASEKIKRYLTNGEIKYLVLHLPDVEGNMPGFKMSDTYLDILAELVAMERVTAMTMSTSNTTLPEIYKHIKGKHTSTVYRKLPRPRRGLGFRGWRRGGSLNTKNLDEKYLLPEVKWETPISCASTPFYDSNVVMPNGDVHLCCMDYGGKHILGNLIRDSYESLHMSSVMGNIIKVNKQCEFSEGTICRKCEDVSIHKFKYDGHGWESFRPGHLSAYIGQLKWSENRQIALLKIIRGGKQVADGVKNFLLG